MSNKPVVIFFIFIAIILITMNNCNHPEIFDKVNGDDDDDSSKSYQPASQNSSIASSQSESSSESESTSNTSSSSDSESSDSSISSTSSVIPAINNLTATVLERSSNIQLNWDSVTGADSYKIYRYIDKSDTNPALLTSLSNQYNDNDASTDTSYYYKVSFVDNSVEDGTTDFVFGLFSNGQIDYEINNDVSDDLNTTFPTDPFLYSFPDGIGGKEVDVDWYKYYFSGPGSFTATIKLAQPTAFAEGDVKFIFFINGSYDTPTLREILTGAAGTTVNYTYSGSDPVYLYYKIYVDENVVGDSAVLENYEVDIW